MELRASMELGDGRGGQLGEEDSPYIVMDKSNWYPLNQPVTYGIAAPDRLYYRKALRYYR